VARLRPFPCPLAGHAQAPPCCEKGAGGIGREWLCHGVANVCRRFALDKLRGMRECLDRMERVLCLSGGTREPERPPRARDHGNRARRCGKLPRPGRVARSVPPCFGGAWRVSPGRFAGAPPGGADGWQGRGEGRERAVYASRAAREAVPARDRPAGSIGKPPLGGEGGVNSMAMPAGRARADRHVQVSWSSPSTCAARRVAWFFGGNVRIQRPWALAPPSSFFVGFL